MTTTVGSVLENSRDYIINALINYQRLQAPKTWIGSKEENVLILLSELMQVVKELADTLATHTHSGVVAGPATTKGPVQASVITEHGVDSGDFKIRVDVVTKR
ncbi:hypothetical protein KP803_11235 [Vibrio sp. ZSDE26]|uniref:Uncharacterized protein n=1 Tax=Vibrio amylolyticus TaxID=2847292 RepID=A0A9X2BJW7_9VIBR|nr:hypothetical protein [Vibrio amylolyticus]MCK6263842.1 hypothetical protein [Vibrio amylolyticus]